MSTSEKTVKPIQRSARASALAPTGWKPRFHLSPDLRFARSSVAKVQMQPMALATKKITTAVRDRNLPIRTEEMVEIESESGRLQKMRSMSERLRKPWKSVDQAKR